VICNFHFAIGKAPWLRSVKKLIAASEKVPFPERQMGFGSLSVVLVGFVLKQAKRGVAPMGMKIVECRRERGRGAAFGGDLKTT